MNKPEYSDLYKFIASIGIILLASSVLVPWLFLRESFDIYILASDIDNLTPIAQKLVFYRQSTVLWLFERITSISLGLGLGGTVFLIFGVYFWWNKKQKLQDKKDDLEVRKLEKDIGDQSPQEIAVGIVKKTIEQEELDAGATAFEIRQSKYIEGVQEYFDTEKTVLSKLALCFDNASVLPHKKIGSSEVDVLVRVGQSKRILLEITRAENLRSLKRHEKRAFEVISRALKSYSEIMPGRKAYGVGIMIVDDASLERASIEFEKFELIPFEDRFIMKMIFTKSEFEKLACKEFRELLLNFVGK